MNFPRDDICQFCERTLFLNTDDGIVRAGKFIEFPITTVFDFNDAVIGYNIFLHELIMKPRLNNDTSAVKVIMNIDIGSELSTTLPYTPADLVFISPAKPVAFVPLSNGTNPAGDSIIAFEPKIYRPYFVSGNLPANFTIGLIDDSNQTYVPEAGTNILFEFWLSPVYDPNVNILI